MNYEIVKLSPLGIHEPHMIERGAMRDMWLYGALWDLDYEFIASEFAEQLALAPPDSELVFSIDSPGGMCTGLDESCHDIAKLRGSRPDVKIIVFTQGDLCSAAYQLACALTSGERDEIVATAGACVGSIGVMIRLVEVDPETAMPGVKYTYITSAAFKAEGFPGKPYSDETLAQMQAEVQRQADVFYEYVAAARGLSVEQIAALQAACFYGDEALRVGLVDRLVASKSELQAPEVMEPDNTMDIETTDTDPVAPEPEQAAAQPVLAKAADQVAQLTARLQRAETAILLAARPDLSAETRAAFADLPAAQVEAVLRTLPAAKPEPKVTEVKSAPMGAVEPVMSTSDSYRGCEVEALPELHQRRFNAFRAPKPSAEVASRIHYDTTKGVVTIR